MAGCTWTATDADGDTARPEFTASVGQGICDRTRQVRFSILDQVRYVTTPSFDEVSCG